jgi:hypothetical protein
VILGVKPLPGLFTAAAEFTAETDWLAEGEGFEPSVPRKRDRTSGANVRSSESRLPILSTHLH